MEWNGTSHRLELVLPANEQRLKKCWSGPDSQLIRQSARKLPFRQYQTISLYFSMTYKELEGDALSWHGRCNIGCERNRLPQAVKPTHRYF
jgi:hypothetical protein